MTPTFVHIQSRSHHPVTYACWLTVGNVTVKEVGPSKGIAYWRALTMAYLTLRGVQL